MIDIPLNLRVPPQGRYNSGIFTCNGLAETSAGVMVVWECPRCGQKWMFHYRAQNDRESFDYAAMLIAYRQGDPEWMHVRNPDWEKAVKNNK